MARLVTAAVERAPAKINLCLHVTGRRPDGYHELDTVVAFAMVGDTVRIEPADNGAILQVSRHERPAGAGSAQGVVPAHTGNLAWRALAFAASLAGGIDGVRLTLDKRLPAGAGLGGGSSDAAAVLRSVLRATGGSGLPAGAASGATRLGADVPMCLDPRPWRARGIGERLEPAAIARDLPAVLAWPGRPVATPAVFAARSGAFGAPVPAASLARLAIDPIGALRDLRNDLTAAACAVEPSVATALAAMADLPGCRLARMSGSGSAVFGLFDDAPAAAKASEALQSRHPDWWIRATTLCAARAETALPG